MRYLCPIGCGCLLENDIHKFSDGFKYRSPKELDHKPHRCAISEIVYNVAWQGWEPIMDEIFSYYKKRLAISYEDFEDKIEKSILDTGSKILGSNYINVMLPMLRHGKLYELIAYHQNNIINHTLPFLKYRQTSYSSEIEFIPRHMIDDSTDNDDLCDMIPVIVPTDNGYQLEYLGFCYELMTKFEDAKKCYELQYEFTKEQELLDKSAKLYKKIMSMDKIPWVELKLEDTEKELKHTEANLRKYVAELFSNDFREIYKRDPILKKMVQKSRSEHKNSLLQIKDKGETDDMMLGNLNVILKKCRTKALAKLDGSCKKCDRTWEKRDEIFLETYPRKIVCTDETCFKKQNGLFKDVKQEFQVNVEIITKFRNNNSHVNEYESEEMFNYSSLQTYFTCKVINNEIDNFLAKNPYI